MPLFHRSLQYFQMRVIDISSANYCIDVIKFSRANHFRMNSAFKVIQVTEEHVAFLEEIFGAWHVEFVAIEISFNVQGGVCNGIIQFKSRREEESTFVKQVLMHMYKEVNYGK